MPEGFYRLKPGPFSKREVELIESFADQAVIAIENTRLLNELRESLQQQTATSEVLQVISGSPGELEPVFQAMLANATHICEAKFGTLWLCEGDAFRAVALHNAPPASSLGVRAATCEVARLPNAGTSQVGNFAKLGRLIRCGNRPENGHCQGPG